MSATQRFVKLDTQYYEVVIGDNGLLLKPVDVMQYLSASVEKSVLGNEVMGLAEDDDNVLQQVIDQARDELIKTLKADIKNTVLACLGFEKDRWGGAGFKVDHCNGRMSTVTELISNELKKELLNVQINPEFCLTDEEKQDLRETMRKDFAERYRNEVHRKTWEVAQRLAIDDIQEISKQLMGSKKKDIAADILDRLLKSNKK